MKILHIVSSYEPSLDGMQQVVKQLSERLVTLGHNVTVATSFHKERTIFKINGVDITSFKITGNAVTGYEETAGEIDRYINFVRTSSFDIVTIFAAQQWSCDILLPVLNEIPAKKVFVPTGFSQLFNPKYLDYFVNMQGWLRSFDKLIFLSNDYRDINFARDHGITNFEVIPNGAAKDEFSGLYPQYLKKELGIPNDHLLILNVSTHTGLKGHTEAIRLFKKASLKKATLLIVGNKLHYSPVKTFLKRVLSVLTPVSGKAYFPECYNSCRRKALFYNLGNGFIKKSNKILIKDLDRARVLQAYTAADLFLFTSNIECSPIVLFECLASKTPFLTTDVGNAKEIIAWSGAGQLLPTTKNNQNFSIVKIDESIPMLREFVENKQLREKMAESGYITWSTNFTWEIISKKYEEAYQSIL